MRSRASSRLLPLLLVALLAVQAAAALPTTDPGGVDAGGEVANPGGVAGFLENGGQADPAVLMTAWTPGGGVALTRGGAVFTLVDDATGTGWNVRTDLAGAPGAVPAGEDPLPGVTNFILGDDPDRWATGLRTYREAVYRDAWDGIDLVYRVEGGGVKYDLVLRPGSDPEDARFDVSGHLDLRVDGRGDLVISTGAGALRDTGLVAFYADGPGEEVPCRFQLVDGDTYGFRLGEYDPFRTVVIDPLVYSTYIGGGAGELEEPMAGVVLDGAGRPLLAGQTNTTDFPVTTGAFQASNAGGATDLFVLRLAPDGSDVEWATYVGGSGADYPYDIAVDSAGRPVVVGRTNSTDLPTTAGAHDTSHAGPDHEGFLLKLNAQGTGLVFSSYLGGNNTDELAAVVLDGADGIHVAGNTRSPDLPSSPTAAFPNMTGLAFDAFVASVRADGSAVDALTYLGGAKWDVALSIDVDAGGSVYVGGETLSTDLPATNGSFQDFLMNNLTKDGFIAKLDPGLGSLSWATYVGGMFDDTVGFVHAAANGSVVAAGDTESGGFPVTNGSFQTVHQGATDTFILQIAANGSRLETSTFLGGSDDDLCEGLHVNATGVVTVVGSTLSPEFPTMTGVQQEDRAGTFDTYLFRLDSDGATPLYSTYFGGARWDLANGVDVDDAGHAVVAGATDSVDLPTTTGAYQEDHGGRVDVYVMELDLFLDTERPVSRPGTDMIVDQHDTVDFDGSASTDNVGIANWTWELTYDGVLHLIHTPAFSWTFDLAGKYYVYLTVRDAVNLTDRQWVSVYVSDTEAPVAVAPADVNGQQHWTVTLDGGASTDNVGVAVHTWTFTYDGEERTLTGGKVEFTFHEAGTFVITLTVEDAAGNNDTDTLNVTIIDITPPDLVIDEEDISVGQHTEVLFNASASTDNVGITSVSWQFVYAGSPFLLDGLAPAFVFDRAGTYRVTVTAEDANGNRAFGEVSVLVADTTPPVAVAGSNVTIDQGDTVDLDAGMSTDNVDIVDWQWSVDMAGTVTNFSGVKNAFTFNSAGTFSVTLTVADAGGNSAVDAFTVRVRDITPPVAVAGESEVIGQGETLTLDGSASTDNVGIVTYNWVLSKGPTVETGDGPTFEHTFPSVGTYLVSLQVFDGSGLSDTDELTVVVLDAEMPVADAGADIEVELDGTVTFDGSASTDNVNVVSWEWTFNYNQAQVTLEGAEPTFTFELLGTYFVTLNVTDDAGNYDTDTVSVSVTSEDGGGSGGSGGDGGLGGALLLVVVAVVLVAVAALFLPRLRRGGEERVVDDLGWAPTEEEKRDRDDKDDEGVFEGDEGDGRGVPGDK